MPSNKDINQKLQQQLDELSEKHIINLFEHYDDRVPLIDAVKSGEQFIWKSSLLRNFIAEKLMTAPRKTKGRPPSLQNDMQSLNIMMYLYYLRGAGVHVKGVKKDGSPSACEIVAKFFHKEPDTIESVWKKYNKKLNQGGTYSLLALSERLGKQNNFKGAKIPDLITPD